MRDPGADLASAISRPVPASALGAFAITLLYLVAFPYRQDYAAHASGGYALVLLAAGGLAATGRYRAWAPIWSWAAAVAVALAAELTLFGGIIDLVEVSISALGAGLAAAVLHRFTLGESAAPATVVALGSVLMVVAVMLRFQLPGVIIGG